MKKILYTGALSLLLLTACNEESTKKEEVSTGAIAKEKTEVKETKQEDSKNKNEVTINTSVFKFAKSVEVTDARSTNKHITLKIELSDDAQAGTGTLNVLKQMYDFLQQKDIKGAETITYLIRSNDTMLAQFTTNVSKFSPDNKTSMADVVLKASVIDKMNAEVKTFGQTMELWN